MQDVLLFLLGTTTPFLLYTLALVVKWVENKLN